MYYDDQARQFNFATGLTLGALLGVGLAILLAPKAGTPSARRARPKQRLVRAGGAVRESVAEALRAARSAAR